jgi:thioredoxin 1
MNLFRDLTCGTFESETLASSRPVIVAFYAPQCPESQRLDQMLNELAPVYRDRLEFGAVNVAKAGELASRYRVYSVPGLVVLFNNTVLYQVMGVLPRRELKTIFDVAARHPGVGGPPR